MGPNQERTSVTRWSLFGHSRPRISSDKPSNLSIESKHRQHTTQAVIKGQLKFLRGKQWCPGADSNHRHADFQSAALPTELPGLPAGGTACEDLPKSAEANGITACQHAVQREIEALPASKNSMCAGGYSCSGGLPAPASDSTIESSAPSTAGMA